ncbi:hypothetical protein EYF80_063024 [Liparis tanakae]|uniref:Uncharacterized protein n=1 Tax=Liparis tanakae TaxID=230148 RepID=A0A4Z2ED56_9TELE|nr:hypothetical protein EYF80_063024 [Liparis tanakae]
MEEKRQRTGNKSSAKHFHFHFHFHFHSAAPPNTPNGHRPQVRLSKASHEHYRETQVRELRLSGNGSPPTGLYSAVVNYPLNLREDDTWVIGRLNIHASINHSVQSQRPITASNHSVQSQRPITTSNHSVQSQRPITAFCWDEHRAGEISHH